MLEISPSAADLIRSLTEPRGRIQGIRVMLGPAGSSNGHGPSAGVIIAPASGPVEEDETVEDGGAAVFIDPEAVPWVEDKILDVAVSGADQLQFTLIDQTEGDL
jgi:Fe-S cluster assembly iron-binding protein IscA